jgi:hypothetical protein
VKEEINLTTSMLIQNISLVSRFSQPEWVFITHFCHFYREIHKKLFHIELSFHFHYTWQATTLFKKLLKATNPSQPTSPHWYEFQETLSRLVWNWKLCGVYVVNFIVYFLSSTNDLLTTQRKKKFPTSFTHFMKIKICFGNNIVVHLTTPQ